MTNGSLKNYVLGSNKSIRAMYRYRNHSAPTEGNRSIFNLATCMTLLVFLLASLIAGEFQQLSVVTSSTPIQTSFIARHLMAIFVLLLFLLIDGSPETLGLGVFLGLESIARALDYGWMIAPYSGYIQHTLFQAGDIMRLYFAVQLARIAPKNMIPWLVTALLVSIPYGIAMEASPSFREHFGGTIRAFRDCTIGIIGAWITGRVAIALVHDRLPWRVAALTFGSIAFLEAPLYYVVLRHTSLMQIESIQAFFEVYRSLSYLGFALAAFINISTIENRIRALSSAKAEAQIKRIDDERRLHEAIAKTTQMLAHDVRKPLSLVQAYANTITHCKTIEEAQSVLQRMLIDVQKSLNSVDHLIKNVFDASREISVVRQEVDIAALLKPIIEQVFQTSKNPNISLHYAFRHDGVLLGDGSQLTRVFANILENAEQAIEGQRSDINIETHNDASSGQEMIAIVIHNTNSWIASEKIPLIFDAFFTSGKVNGTGLGLAIVKRIIEAHDGEVSVTSSKDFGTSFKIILPARYLGKVSQTRLPTTSRELIGEFSRIKLDLTGSKLLTTSPANPLRDSHSRLSSTLRFLVLDDELVYLDAMRALIERNLSDVSITEAHTASEAELELGRSSFDVILCDYDLGVDKPNGSNILALAAQLNPFALLILHTNRIINIASIDIGHSFHHLQKPANEAQFLSLVDTYKGQRELWPSLRVAVVEDEDIFCENLRRKLPLHQINIFSSADEFLDRYMRENSRVLHEPDFDVVVTDIHFDRGVKDGLHVADFVREVFPNIPIFAFTNMPLGQNDSTKFKGSINKDASNARQMIDAYAKSLMRLNSVDGSSI